MTFDIDIRYWYQTLDIDIGCLILTSDINICHLILWYKWILDIVDIAGGRKGKSKTLCPGETAWPGTRERWDGHGLHGSCLPEPGWFCACAWFCSKQLWIKTVQCFGTILHDFWHKPHWYCDISWWFCSWFITMNDLIYLNHKAMSHNLLCQICMSFHLGIVFIRLIFKRQIFIRQICMSFHLGIVFVRLGTGARPSHTLQWDHQLANGRGGLKYIY